VSTTPWLIDRTPLEAGSPADAVEDRLAGQVYASVVRALDTRGPQADVPRADLVDDLIASSVASLRQSQIAAGQQPLDPAAMARLTRRVRDDLVGMGALQPLLDDPKIINIELVGTDVFVQHTGGDWAQLAPVFDTETDLQAWVRAQAAHAPGDERRFDRGSPAVSVRLPDGSRMFAVMEVAARTSVSIRRHHYTSVTLADLIRLGTLSPGLAGLLNAAVGARLNIVVAGGMNLGKTTLLRALAAGIEPVERLVTVEQAFELGLHHDDRHPNMVALQARMPNVEGIGEITVAAQVDWAKQMNASRVIVGEVRGPEVVPMIEAMSLGCDGSMATVHASTSAQALRKLQMYCARAADGLPFQVSATLIGMAVDLVVCLGWAGDVRVVTSVREVTGADGDQVASNEVFRPGPDNRAVYAMAPSATTARLRQVGFNPATLSDDRNGWR
jgi:Flp pilus assembly CpaF family ATPase